MDAKGASDEDISGSNLQINLKPISHPGALPPVRMMNWLVALEELRSEHLN